jgi:hypothetical protein
MITGEENLRKEAEASITTTTNEVAGKFIHQKLTWIGISTTSQ